jgi:ribosomal protein S19E (S16A)
MRRRSNKVLGATRRQCEYLAAIEALTVPRGPNAREIAAQMGLTGGDHAKPVLDLLRLDGFIERVNRGFVITETGRLALDKFSLMNIKERVMEEVENDLLT